jgi:hypothetical protein
MADSPPSPSAVSTQEDAESFRFVVRWCGDGGGACPIYIDLSPQHLSRILQYQTPPPPQKLPFESVGLTCAELVPVNLYPETDVVGPTSLNAVNFITLGLPTDSEFGPVTTETFSLNDGWLSEEGGLQVHFSEVEGLAGNEDGVTQSSVLKAGECFEESGFCIDGDGYLVSLTPVGNFPAKIPPFSFSVFVRRADFGVAGDGSFVAGRIKFYACPNEEQDTFGGGEYKVFSNNAADVDNCLPIYLGVKGPPQ